MNAGSRVGSQRMSNVIEFKKPPKPKEPKPPRPGLKKALVILAVIAAFALVWVYFYTST